MIPAKTVNQYISEFKSRGLGVDSTQQFSLFTSILLILPINQPV
jgi:hypothetical protein